MAITGYTITRSGKTAVAKAASDLSGTVFYHWFLDGKHVARTVSDTLGFQLRPTDEVRLVVLDTHDADYDWLANAPTGYSARRTVGWIRSLATDVDHYKVEQQRDGGAWVEVANVPHDETAWWYEWTSDRLVDLSAYVFRITPVDTNGVDGTPTSTPSETMVRTPDGVDFTAALVGGPPPTVSFTAA